MHYAADQAAHRIALALEPAPAGGKVDLAGLDCAGHRLGFLPLRQGAFDDPGGVGFALDHIGAKGFILRQIRVCFDQLADLCTDELRIEIQVAHARSFLSQ